MLGGKAIVKGTTKGIEKGLKSAEQLKMEQEKERKDIMGAFPTKRSSWSCFYLIRQRLHYHQDLNRLWKELRELQLHQLM